MLVLGLLHLSIGTVGETTTPNKRSPSRSQGSKGPSCQEAEPNDDSHDTLRELEKAASMARLLLKTSGSPGLTLHLSKVNRLGRNADNELRIPEPSVSVFIVRLPCLRTRCSSGSRLDQRNPHQRRPRREGTLEPGESLQIGVVRLLLEIEAENHAADHHP